jgi:hypothetical protein
MSLQFSYEFAIFISVCNSYVTTPALTYLALHGLYVTMTLNSLTPRQPRFSMEDKDKLKLSKIDYYLLVKQLRCYKGFGGNKITCTHTFLVGTYEIST